MADESAATSGNEGKKVSRVDSFSKLLRSPLSSKSLSSKSPKKSSSGNPLTKLLFRRKSSKSKGIDGADKDANVEGADEEDQSTPTSLIEEVKEVVGSAIDGVLHRDNEPKADVATPTKSQEESSTGGEETKDDNKHSLLDKFKEELLEVSEQPREFVSDLLGKSKEGVEIVDNADLKEDYGKIRAELKQILHKDINPSSMIDEAQKLKGEAVASVASTIDDTQKVVSTTRDLSNDNEAVVKKKEDSCVSTLAQGLENICCSWGSKKQE